MEARAPSIGTHSPMFILQLLLSHPLALGAAVMALIGGLYAAALFFDNRF